MRVTQRTKDETRDRILATARSLFAERGFDGTTTRDLAAGAGIATGTLFNYFASKEALAMAIVSEAMDVAEGETVPRIAEVSERALSADEALVETLFGHIATGLRELEPCRAWAATVLDATVSPATTTHDEEAAEAEAFRQRHLETVVDLLGRYMPRTHPSLLTMHLYWTLYLGVLAYWSRDPSPDQQDTLALLDQSLRLFVGAVRDSEDKQDTTDDR